MHDIWNPWHGCVKKSEGCVHCYIYAIDKMRGRSGADIYRTKAAFNYPLQRDRQGLYKVKSGEMLRVCMTSDFFLEEADPWREEAWDIMRERWDVIFFLLTKRPERVKDCLPLDWRGGWENVFFNVTCENQRRADERIPILLELPFKHKGIMCAPLLGPIDISKYLVTGQIEQVLCDGENYDGARPCDFAWVQKLGEDCRQAEVTFCFCSIGNCFVKDGKTYRLKKGLQTEMARKSGVSCQGRPIDFKLHDPLGMPLASERYVPHFREKCGRCGMQSVCNGCSDCGKCESHG